jgi:hypothetical protein
VASFVPFVMTPLVVLVCLFQASDLHAQSVVPGPPGPYVFDVRATTMGVPQAFGFYPDVPTDILVPSRGFGVDLGGHIYVGQLGAARLGVGATYVQLRGTAGEVAITVRTLTPQVSVNFGTSRGWSYLSGGLGIAQVRGRYAPAEFGGEGLTRSSDAFRAMNAGGGARWFIRPRLAFTLDLRVHRLGSRAGVNAPPTPASFLGAAAAGFSFR